MTASLYTFPWNLGDLDRNVAEIRALGIDEITLAASYHAGKFIQPRDTGARVYFPEDGTVYFRASPRRYGQLQPAVAAIAQRADTLHALTACDGVRVNAWLVLNHNTRLGMLHPQVTVRNCFGDPYVYSLCPSHAAVREYCIALACDVAENYDIGSMLLETPGFLGYAHGFHHEFAQVAPNRWLETMLALCFCEQCSSGAQSSGIDVCGLSRRIRAAVDEYLQSDVEMTAAEADARLQEWNTTDSDLVRLHAWRADVVTTLVSQIRAAVRPDVAVRVISTTQQGHGMAYIEGGDLAALHAASDGIEAPLYQPDPDAVDRDLRLVLATIGGPACVSAILRPGYPDMKSEEQLARTLQCVQARGVRRLAFYNYGMLRSANLQWLRRCLEAR